MGDRPPEWDFPRDDDGAPQKFIFKDCPYRRSEGLFVIFSEDTIFNVSNVIYEKMNGDAGFFRRPLLYILRLFLKIFKEFF